MNQDTLTTVNQDELIQKLQTLSLAELNALAKEIVEAKKKSKRQKSSARKNEEIMKSELAKYLVEKFNDDDYVKGLLQIRGGKIFIDFLLIDGQFAVKVHFPIIKK